ALMRPEQLQGDSRFMQGLPDKAGRFVRVVADVQALLAVLLRPFVVAGPTGLALGVDESGPPLFDGVPHRLDELVLGNRDLHRSSSMLARTTMKTGGRSRRSTRRFEVVCLLRGIGRLSFPGSVVGGYL